MEKLEQLLNGFAKLNLNEIARELLISENVRKYILYLQTDEQMFRRGEDAEGMLLSDIGGYYAPSTVKRKERQGLPSNRVTLFDTGEFYRSFEVKYGADYFELDGNTMKDGQDLMDRWGKNIEGLSDNSKEMLIEFITDDFEKLVDKKIRSLF